MGPSRIAGRRAAPPSHGRQLPFRPPRVCCSPRGDLARACARACALRAVRAERQRNATVSAIKHAVQYDIAREIVATRKTDDGARSSCRHCRHARCLIARRRGRKIEYWARVAPYPAAPPAPVQIAEFSNRVTTELGHLAGRKAVHVASSGESLIIIMLRVRFRRNLSNDCLAIVREAASTVLGNSVLIAHARRPHLTPIARVPPCPDCQQRPTDGQPPRAGRSSTRAPSTQT